MCLYPKLIKNRKYTANKKNGGNIPAVPDDRVKWVPIGCQKCIECKKKKAREWQARLTEEIKQSKNGKFITLTFSDEHIAKLYSENTTKSSGYDLDNDTATLAVRRFLERWRKKYKKSLKHWLTTELGHTGTENIHLHGIIWTDVENWDTEIKEKWSYGFTWTGDKNKNYVNEQTVNYIIKYVTKTDQLHKEYNPIILTSPGIGNNYTTREHSNATRNAYIPNKTDETYRLNNGAKIGLPIYYRNKIYTEEQREKLWLEKLDKNERWICGEKVPEDTNEQEFYNLLNWHRQRNIELGYSNDEKDWEQDAYERERRQLKQLQRIHKAKK